MPACPAIALATADCPAKRLCYTTPAAVCNCDHYTNRIFLKKYFQRANNWNKSAYTTSYGQKPQNAVHKLCRGSNGAEKGATI